MNKILLMLVGVVTLNVWSALGQSTPWREATTAEMVAGTQGAPAAVTPRRLADQLGGTNGSSGPTFAVILHTNKTFTIYTNGITGAPTTISASSSTTAGWNEVQSYFQQSTNSPFAGFRLMIDAGLYPFTTQLIISNRCMIQGAGTAGTIFRYVGPTNFATMQNITNCLAGASGDACAQRTAPYALLYCASNHQDSAGIESSGFWNVTVNDISIQTATNMFCFGISINGGDFTIFERVAVGGPEMFTKPSYYNEFMTGDQIPEPSKMIGFVIGGNQPKLNDCRALAVADGVVALGDSFLTLNDFKAIALDYVGADGATPYPATSELSLNSAILVPKISQCEFLSVNHILCFDCWNDFYLGTTVAVNVNEWRDQNAPFIGFQAKIWKGATTYASMLVTATTSAISTMAYTNDATGFIQNVSQTPLITEFLMGAGGSISLYDGQQTFFSATGSTIQWSGTVGNNIQLQGGKKFIGDAIGLTNIIYPTNSAPPSFAQIGSTTNVTFMWNSNPPTSKTPTNWLQYYAAPSTLTTITHFP